MFIAMYGCHHWSYGESDFRCENDSAGGLAAAAFFILFILLSALIMLNLVIGSICSSMSEAQEAYEMEDNRDKDVKKLVAQTLLRGRDFNMPGISEEVIRAWIKEFERMDSATSALALEASIDQDDIDTVLELIGEQGTLKAQSIEQLLIRANHTVPIGLVDMMAFMTALAMDLMSVRIKELSDSTGWVVIASCSGLDWSDPPPDGPPSSSRLTPIDPYCVVVLNGEEVGRTHTLSHTCGNAEWNERLGVPIELLRSKRNTFTIEVNNAGPKGAELLGTFTVAVEGKHLPGLQEPQDYALVPNPRAKSGHVVKNAKIRLSVRCPLPFSVSLSSPASVPRVLAVADRLFLCVTADACAAVLHEGGGEEDHDGAAGGYGLRDGGNERGRCGGGGR